MPARSVMSHLRQDDRFSEWMVYLDDLDEPAFEIVLPDDQAYVALLRELDVPVGDIHDVIASRPDRQRDPGLWWLLERCVASLVSSMGRVTVPPMFPSPRDVPGMDPYFFVHVFVATYPHVKAFHRSRRIPEGISRATLADLGRNIQVNHKRYGTGGLSVAFWISLHFRGAIYQLGRLQFERSKMRAPIAEALARAGADATPDDLVLSLHIPDFSGPLSPEACDASIEQARQFFADHFPEERYDYAVCHSWLLDPQLKEYLSETSNIVRFQDRFNLSEHTREADQSIVQFVFGPTAETPEELPRRSSLERAVADHLKAGRHWHVRSGWFRFEH